MNLKNDLVVLTADDFSSYIGVTVDRAGIRDIVIWKNTDSTFRILILTDSKATDRTHDHYSEADAVALLQQIASGDLSQIQRIIHS